MAATHAFTEMAGFEPAGIWIQSPRHNINRLKS
jgi:hypothetical protein